MAGRPRGLAGALKHRLTWLGLVLLALVGVAGYRVGWHLWALSHSRAAQRSLQRHDLTGAQAHLALCLEVWPDSAETHFLAARTARRAGDEEEMRLHLKECARLGW